MNNLFFREMDFSSIPILFTPLSEQSVERFIEENFDDEEPFPDTEDVMSGGKTNGHNTGQVSRSGVPGVYELTAGSIGIWEQDSGSGSGQPQAKILGTDAPTAVAEQSSKKSNGKGALYSKRHRDKIKKLEQEMKDEMGRLREENEKLKSNRNESDTKLDVLGKKMLRYKERSARYKDKYRNLQIQVNSLSKKLENVSYLQEENMRLKAEKEFLIQLLNPDTKGKNLAKKWLKIPLENRVLKIKRNVLSLKIA